MWDRSPQHSGCGGGFSGRQSWCVAVLWGSCPELLGAACPPQACCLAAPVLSAMKQTPCTAALCLPGVVRVPGVALVCHCVTSASVLAMVGQEPIISACGMFQGLLPPAHRQAWLLGFLCHQFALPCASAPAVLGTLLWGMAGQRLGALARAMRSCNPGSRQGAPRTAKACPDPLLCSLLDGSLHKHLICKVSVPRHGDPCQVPQRAGGRAWAAEAPAECWRGRAVPCPTPGIPLLGHGWHRAGL